MVGCRYPRNAQIQNLTDTVVEISFPKTKGFDYSPGQYIYLAVPDISLLEWHPFSISSAPHQNIVTMHIRSRGNWTKKLQILADMKDNINILVEGPYGAISVDIFSKRYNLIMLLSGGIGVTPMQSICHQLMHEHDIKRRALKKLRFIWTARDPAVMENMDVTKHGSLRLNDIKYSRLMSDAAKKENSAQDKIAGQPTTSRVAKGILIIPPDYENPDEDFERGLLTPDKYASDNDDEVERNKSHLPVGSVCCHDRSTREGPKSTASSNIHAQDALSMHGTSLDVDEEKGCSPDQTEFDKGRLKTPGESTTRMAVPKEENVEDQDVLKLDFFLTADKIPQ
eukprot:9166195-Ditylum_brightwellii.AAC.1